MASFIRNVSINKRTGQPSVTLPKKKILKLFRKVPKKVVIVIKEIRW